MAVYRPEVQFQRERIDNEEAFRKRQLDLQERQMRLQNDPGRLFLKTLVTAGPQALFQTLGKMGVDALQYKALGGERKVEAQEDAVQTAKDRLLLDQDRLTFDIGKQYPGSTRNKSLEKLGFTENQFGFGKRISLGGLPPSTQAAPATSPPKEAYVPSLDDFAKLTNNMPQAKMSEAVAKWNETGAIESTPQRQAARANLFLEYGGQPPGAGQAALTAAPAATPKATPQTYAGQAAQPFESGSPKSVPELASEATLRAGLSKQGAAELKEWKTDVTKLSDQFRKRSGLWGQELKIAQKSKEPGSYEKTKSRHLDEQYKFIASLSDMLEDLPPEEQGKARNYLSAIKASGSLPSEIQAIYDYELLESGGSTPNGYSKMAKFKRPARSASEYTALGNDARRNQTDANTKYLMADIAERNGQTEQAAALRKEADVLQKNATSLARQSKGRASLANDKVVLGETLTKEQKAIEQNMQIRKSNPKLYAENAARALLRPEQLNQKLGEINAMTPEDAMSVGDELYKLTGGHRSKLSYLDEEAYSNLHGQASNDGTELQTIIDQVFKDPNMSEGARITVIRAFKKEFGTTVYSSLSSDTFRKNLIFIKNRILAP
jgi:hypothetical protein